MEDEESGKKGNDINSKKQSDSLSFVDEQGSKMGGGESEKKGSDNNEKLPDSLSSVDEQGSKMGGGESEKNGDDNNEKKPPDLWKLVEKHGPKIIRWFYRTFINSLLFAVIKASLLIFVLVHIIFAIKPNQSYVSAKISEIDEFKTSYKADSVLLKSKECDEISFSSKEAIRISLANCKVEEWDSSDAYRYWLVIYPREDEGDTYCSFQIMGQMNEVRLFDVSAEELLHGYVSKSECSFVGPQILTIEGKAVIETDDGEKKAELEGDYFNIVEREERYYGDYPSKPYYSPTYVDVSNPVKSYKALIESCSPIDHDEYYKNRENMTQNIEADLSCSGGSMSVGDIVHLDTIVTGETTITYTLTPQEFCLVRQEIELICKSKTYSDFNLELNLDEMTGTLTGYVTEGKISRISIFPSFKTWFYSNAYMAPSAIITIVLSATALFSKNKEHR